MNNSRIDCQKIWNSLITLQLLLFFRFSEQISVHFAIRHEGAATIFEEGMLSTYVNTKFSPLLKKFLGSKMFIKIIHYLPKSPISLIFKSIIERK